MADTSAGYNRGIVVAVKDGIVTLAGYVGTYVDKWAAEKAAKGVAARPVRLALPGDLLSGLWHSKGQKSGLPHLRSGPARLSEWARKAQLRILLLWQWPDRLRS